MKINILTILLLGAITLTACSPQASPTVPAGNKITEQSSRLAEVQSLEVLTSSGTNTQVRILVRGTMAAQCAVLRDPLVNHQDFNFEIQLMYDIPQSQNCSQQPVDFEKIISLDMSGSPDGNYTFSVNHVSAAYTLKSEQTESSALAALSPTPQPTVSAQENIPVTAPQSKPASEASAKNNRGCTDLAAFYGDVTIPDNTSFEQNTPFVKTWSIRNEGTCAWGAGYSLVFAGGDIMNGPLSTPLPDIQPGEVKDISINLVSPAQGGLFTGNYEFENPEGVHFGVNSGGGDKIWVTISVSWYQPGQSAPSSGIPVSQQNGSCSYSENSAYNSQLADLINQARANEGLPALEVDARLNAAAMKHSLDMGCQGYLDHTGSDGSKWGQRIQAEGYSYSYASENIYAGSPDFGGDAQGAFDWWMNSTVHRNNILSKKITQIGIGYVNVNGSPYGGYYTLDFAHP